MKKVLKTVFVAVLMLIFTVCTVYANQETEAQKELLNELGIISAEDLYRDGVTTRAEFVVYALRLKNYTITTGASKPQFTDVAKSYWAYNEISAAYSMGMIKQRSGGRFEPDSPIEANDAARILLCAIGYNDYVKHMTDVNVMRLADSVKLFEGADKTAGVPMDRDSVFKTLFNALVTEMPFAGEVSASGAVEYHIKEGVNILSEYHKIYFAKGIVTADDNTSVYGARAAEGCIIINDESYLADSIDTESWVGMNVGCYWRDNDTSKEVMAIFDEKNTVEEIDFRNAEFIGTAFVENLDSKRINRRINAKTTIVVNGSVIRDNTHITDSLTNYAGDLKMIDNDRDGVYDVVILKRYINIRIASYDDIDKKLKAQNVLGLTDSLGNLLRYEYILDNYNDVVVKDCFLTETDLKELEVDDIASLYLPLDTSHRVEIILGGESFSSELINRNNLDENNEYVVCDDDSEYRLSDYCLIDWSNIIMGEDYSFYPDWRGDIVYLDMKIANTQIGYLRRAHTDYSSNVSKLSILEPNGNIITYDMKEKVSVRKADGSIGGYTHTDVVSNILPASADMHDLNANDGDTAAGNVKQAIMYKLTKDGRVSKIWILTNQQDLIFHRLSDDLPKEFINEEDDEGSVIGTHIKNYYFEYRTNNFMGKYICTSDTPIFVVPRVGNNEEDYRISNTGMFANGAQVRFNNTKQRLYMIAIEPDSFVSDAVIYKLNYSQEKGVPVSTAPAIYYKKVQMINEEGENITRIFTMTHSGTEKSYDVVGCTTLQDSKGRALQYGDIIRVGTDIKGRTTTNTIQLLYSGLTGTDGTAYAYQGDPSTSRYLATVRICPVSEVVARQGNYIKYKTVYGKQVGSEKNSIEMASIASAKVYVFEKRNKTLTESSTARIALGDKFVMYESLGNPRLIVYYK